MARQGIPFYILFFISKTGEEIEMKKNLFFLVLFILLFSAVSLANGLSDPRGYGDWVTCEDEKQSMCFTGWRNNGKENILVVTSYNYLCQLNNISILTPSLNAEIVTGRNGSLRVDKGEIINFTYALRQKNDKFFVDFMFIDSKGFYFDQEIVKMMKKGNMIRIKLGNEKPEYYKFSLKGFTKAFNDKDEICRGRSSGFLPQGNLFGSPLQNSPMSDEDYFTQ